MKVKIKQDYDAGIASYREGTTCDVPDDVAAKLIELGVATAVGAKKKPKAEASEGDE